VIALLPDVTSSLRIETLDLPEIPGVWRYLAREGLRGSGKVARRLRERVLRHRSISREQTPQHASAAYFANQGFDLMRSLLLAPNSLARDILPAQELEQRITSHRQHMGELPMLSGLMTLEVWRRSLHEVKKTLPPTRG
jgi:hypothetical protein